MRLYDLEHCRGRLGVGQRGAATKGDGETVLATYTCGPLSHRYTVNIFSRYRKVPIRWSTHVTASSRLSGIDMYWRAARAEEDEVPN